ncbi:MAG: RNA-binding protein [Desulfurococcaceae archaeon]|jgi:RNA-binding protein
MRLLGITDIYSRGGYLIVKPYVNQVLRCVGAIVHDSVGRKVGVVVDVIGRVNDPRLVVKIENHELGELLAHRKEKLYFTFQRKPKRIRK